MKGIISWRQGFVLAAGIAVSVGFVASAALADGIGDYYYQLNQKRFFDNPQGARTAAMAGSSVVTSMDSSSVLGNPAGLGWMKDAEVSASYEHEKVTGNDIFDYDGVRSDMNGGYAVGAFPIVPYEDALPKYGNFGIGWSGFRTNSDDAFDLDYVSWKIHAAYAKAITEAWSLGYNFAYDHLKTDSNFFEENMNDGIRQSVGAQYKMSDRTMFGLDTSYGFGRGKITDVSPLVAEFLDSAKRRVRSWAIEGGVAQTVFTNTLITASVDYVAYWQNIDENATSWGFRLGAEQPIVNWMKLRAGYRYMANMGFEIDDSENAKYNAVSVGAGFSLGAHFRADYAAEYRAIGDGDWSHWVTLSVPFSLCK